MSWFKTKHPLTVEEQVELESHLHWLIQHLAPAARQMLTASSQDIAQLGLASPEDAPKLEEFVREFLGLEVPTFHVLAIDDDEDLDQPHFHSLKQTVFLRQSQLLNLEESASHIANYLCAHYLDHVFHDAPSNDAFFDSGWLPELVAAYRGMAVMMANSTVKSSYTNDGTMEYMLHIRYRFVPARIFGSFLAYLMQFGMTNDIALSELCLDARDACKRTLKYLQKSGTTLLDSRGDSEIFQTSDLNLLAEQLHSPGLTTRLAAVKQVQKLVLEGAPIPEKNARFIEGLIRQLEEPSELLRLNACELLGRYEHLPEPHLLQVSSLLYDESHEVRALAMRLLNQQGDRGNVDPFRTIQLLQDESILVAHLAAEGAIVFGIEDPELDTRLMVLFQRHIKDADHALTVQYAHMLNLAMEDLDQVMEDFFDEEFLNFAKSFVREARTKAER